MSTIDEIGLQTGQCIIAMIAVIVGMLAAMAFSFWKW